MTHEFGVGEYVTRDGREIVVRCDNWPGDFPLRGHRKGERDMLAWTSDGLYSEGGRNSHMDLMPPKPWSAETVSFGRHAIYKHGVHAFYADCNEGQVKRLVDLLNAGEDNT